MMDKFKYIILFYSFLLSLYADIIKPVNKYTAEGNVIDIVVYHNELYAATDNGVANVFDLNSKKIVKSIKLPQILDFMDELYNPKIFSIDLSPDKKRVLLLAEATGGTRELFIYENEKLNKIIDKDQRLFIKKAKFIDNHKVLLALISNEIILYDIDNKKIFYRKQLSESSFSDFALDEDKKRAVVSCESGEIFYLNVLNGDIIKVYKGANVDNVYKVDIKKDKIVTAGQDRRLGIYDVDTGAHKHIQVDFLIYAAALSPDAKLAAFAMNEQNDIGIVDIETMQIIHKLVGQAATLNTILFTENRHLFSASDDPYILEWRLP